MIIKTKTKKLEIVEEVRKQIADIRSLVNDVRLRLIKNLIDDYQDEDNWKINIDVYDRKKLEVLDKTKMEDDERNMLEQMIERNLSYIIYGNIIVGDKNYGEQICIR